MLSTRYGKTEAVLKERRVAVPKKVDENDALIAAPSAEQTECEGGGEMKRPEVESNQPWQVKLTVTTSLSEVDDRQQGRDYVVMMDFKGASKRRESWGRQSSENVDILSLRPFSGFHGLLITVYSSL